jgi:hypothetical protein
MPYIKRIGIELEGGWDQRPAMPIHGDGSVGDAIPLNYRYAIGEISSRPLLRSQIPEFLEANYPQNVNATCGLHVHTSLCNVGRYSQLATKQFFDYWKIKMEQFGHAYPIKSEQFWDRLNGENTFCRDRFDARLQIPDTTKSGARYRLLNYCYSLHGTLECRALPMFKSVRTALAAINAHLDIIERYLSAARILGRKIEEQRVELNLQPELELRLSEVTYTPVEDETVTVSVESTGPETGDHSVSDYVW